MQFSYKSVYTSILIEILGKKGHILKIVAKMAILWPNIASATLAHASNGHNLAIFHPILTNEYTKMTSSSRRIECNKKLSSISFL